MEMNKEALVNLLNDVPQWNKYRIDNLQEGADLSDANLSDADLRYANLRDANLRYANLRGTNLSYANLRGSILSGATLRDAILSGATLPTGEDWETYLSDVLPVFLTAGGRTIKELVEAPGVLECHSWVNCPTAFAFDCGDIEGVPIYHRPRARQFIGFWDNMLITPEHIKALQ